MHNTLHPAAALQVKLLAAAIHAPIVYTTNWKEWGCNWAGPASTGRLVAELVLNNGRPIVLDEDVVTSIDLPKLVSPFAYAVALHELGHAYERTCDEITAWIWAWEHALFWHPLMTRCVALSLPSYAHRYEPGLVDRFIKELAQAATLR